MRKIKDVLRIHLLAPATSARQIAGAVGCGKTAVSDCLRRAAAAGLSTGEAVVDLDEDDLEQRLYPRSSKPVAASVRPLPDWNSVREELARRDHKVTLALLWQEYKAEHPDGYQ